MMPLCVLHFAILLLAGVSADSDPVLSEASLEAARAVDKMPYSTDGTVSAHWREAMHAASIPLLREHISASVAFEGDASDEVSGKWWRGLLQNDPVTAATAVAHLDYKYLVWGVDGWPEDRAAFLPKYRLVLMECLFEAFEALEGEIVRTEAEVATFVPQEVLPPESLPARASPSSVRDPVLRAEYEARLREMAGQQYAETDLESMRGLRDEVLTVIAGRIPALYASAADTEISSLAEMVCQRSWRASDLTRRVTKELPPLAPALETACKD